MIIRIIDQDQNQIGFLREIDQRDLDDISLLKLLADSRNTYNAHFFTKSESTIETTREFLRTFIATKSKFLYFIFTFDEFSKLPTFQGHLGYEKINANKIEVINVMKIPNSNQPMEIALNTLLLFLRESEKSQCIFLRVLKNNNRAISLYKRCGFIETFNEIDDSQVNMELIF